MECPHCGVSVPADARRCPSCGTSVGGASIAVDARQIDTTGLPPGASFGAAGPTAAVTAGGGVSRWRAGLATGAATVDSSAVALSGGPLSPGQSFSARYHIIRLLGEGGMGAVYQAWDAELGVAVALKVIRADRGVSAEAEKRFKTELLLARQVTHKNVVRIHDLGEIDGIKYITMPYIDGEDLATVLRRDRKVPVARALRLMREIAGGLWAAHEAGVVHRDLKPANIMVDAGDHALIMDFGISASTSDAGTGELIGTPEYMAPEQANGASVDGRADIYAFGLIGYEMLIGPRPATAGSDRLEAMRLRCEHGLPPLRTLDETIPAPLEAFVMRCLERDPAARFASTADLCGALAALDDAGELIPPIRRLTPRLIAAAAVVVVVLLAGTSILTRKAVAPPKQHDPVSVVIADFQNRTGDPAFDHTLEPMLKRALEGASFVSAYDRGAIARTLGVRPPDKLDEVAARELAVKQGLGIVLSGAIERRGDRYDLSVKATQTVTGEVIKTAQATASAKDQVVATGTRLVAAVRTALGDETSESAQLFTMASLTATSLDVVRLYAAAQEAASNGKFEDGLQYASKAVEVDPKFGVGYQLLAVYSQNLRRPQDSEKYINEALRYLDGMTERERYSTRGFFYRLTRDYQQCVKEYGELISRFAADSVGHNGLALCASQLRDMRRATDEMRQVVTLLPNRTIFRDNLALYSDYAGDFQRGGEEAQKVGTSDPYALLALAFAQLGQDQLVQARDTYTRMSAMPQPGATLAASGLGDLAALQGRFSEAVRTLADGAAKDVAAKNADQAAAKFAAIAYAELSRGRVRQAADAAAKALATSKSVKIRFLAARAFVDAGDIGRARDVMADLGSDLQPEPQAYAKILDADMTLKRGDPRAAIKALNDANGLLDTWIGHFDLGRAYLAAGAFIQADSEFDRCLKRRGEALALFLDEEPTYAYLPAVYYYQGRVREALKTASFADSYRAYLSYRGESKEDPLLPDVRKRAGS